MMAAWRTKPVIGIVGGIGAGKSTVAAELVRLGCGLVDADRIGRRVLGDPQVRRRLRRRWGDRVFTPSGLVRREILAAMVFDSPDELAALNRMMHPRMRAIIQAGINSLRKRPGIAAVVLDAAVLLEAGWDEFCSHLVFVKAPRTARARRTARQRRWDQAAWRRREKSQISLDKKGSLCEYTVDNSSTVSHLREQVRRLFCQIVHAADRP